MRGDSQADTRGKSIPDGGKSGGKYGRLIQGEQVSQRAGAESEGGWRGYGQVRSENGGNCRPL